MAKCSIGGVHDSEAPPTKLDSSTVTTEKSWTGFRLHNFLGHVRMLQWCSLYVPHCRYESVACEFLEVECSKIPDHRHPLPPPLPQSKDCLRSCKNLWFFEFWSTWRIVAQILLQFTHRKHQQKLNSSPTEEFWTSFRLHHFLFRTEARRSRECTHASMVLCLCTFHIANWQPTITRLERVSPWRQ